MIALLGLLSAYVLTPDIAPSDVTVLRTAELGLPGAPAEHVSLKHLVPGRSGAVPSAVYSVALPAALDRSRALALYVNSVTPHMSVLVGSTQVGSTRHSANKNSSTAFQPVLIALPHPLPESVNTLRLQMDGPVSNPLMLSSIWIGPLQSLGPVYEHRVLVRAHGALFMALLYALTALASFSFWLSDRSYVSPLWFALFCGAAAMTAWTGLITTEPVLPWAINLHFTIFFLTCSVVALTQFLFEKTLSRNRLTDQLLIGVLALAVVLGFGLYEDALPYFRYALVMDVVCALLGSYALWKVARAWLRMRDELNAILLIGATLALLLGLTTIAVTWTPTAEAEPYSVLYAPLPLIFAMGWVIIRRYARMHLRSEALNRRLAKRVARREQEVRQAYERVAQLERDQTIRGERDRFMRDMHDGLGSQLITSMRMAERGELTAQAMRDVLSDCLDEMHFAIESLKPGGDDLFNVLADYRYRLSARLEAAGIDLQWRVEPTALVRLNAQQIVQVLRIVNEAISNALKHSGASRLRITGQTLGDGYELVVSDFGSGGAFVRAGGNGLKNMQSRADELGARLQIDSNEQGCHIRLLLRAV